MRWAFPIILIVAFLALVVLPTRARNRQVRQMQGLQADLTVGTDVMTSSGLYGRVVALWEDEVDLEVAPGVVTTWTRLAIREARGPARMPPGSSAAPGTGPGSELPDQDAD